MSDQPKPATGEWTVESAEKIVGNIWNRGGIIELLVDAHNAALAAERDEYRKQALSNHTAQDAARSTIKHLQQQLAAEREKVQPLVKALQEIDNGREASADSLRRYAANELARWNQNTGLDWIGRGDQ